MIKLLVLCLLSNSYGALIYDSYHANVIGKEELKRFDKANSTFWCTVQIEPCDPNEGRRIDGSCNNLENPIRGAIHTPFTRVLPPVFDKVDDPRKSKSGNDLPLARKLRTSLLSVGRVSSQTFTQLALHYMVFMLSDIATQHDTADEGINTLAGINMMAIWFWRFHNFIATELAKVNPCWNDDKLFYTARDINIAVAIQIYFYELLPPLVGTKTLKNFGVTEPSLGFRDIYNSSVLPLMYLEYPYVLRWLHTMQDGALKMYDADGNYLKQFPVTNLTLKTGFFAAGDNMVYVTQGAFRQASAKADYIVDPDIAEVGLGPHQRASDLPTNDMAKNRYFGFQPYIKYREYCFSKPVKSYDDLVDVIDPERIEILQEMYEDIEDIDLMAGIWVEKPGPEGRAPPTFSCLVMEQLIRNIVSDRHWYERPNRPNAFTLDQLKEIRKMTVARLLCDVGDSVTKIQPQAFLRIGSGNTLTSCQDINMIDYSVWRDPICK